MLPVPTVLAQGRLRVLRVYGQGSSIKGLGPRVQGLGFRFVRLRVDGFGRMVCGAGCRVQGTPCTDHTRAGACLGIRDRQSLGCRVDGFT